MDELEMIDETISETETKTKKKRQVVAEFKKVLVLELDGIRIWRDSMSYSVTGFKGSIDLSQRGRTSYYPSLTSSLFEVLDRLFAGELE